MNKLVLILVLIVLLAPKANAMEFTAPQVPQTAAERMPDETESFAEGFLSIIQDSIVLIQPALAEAAKTCASLMAVTVLISLIKSFPGSTEYVVEFVGALVIAVILIKPSKSLVHLGVDTVKELSEYAKLFFPVMTAALAAQGGSTTSAALYTGTVLFDTFLSTLVSGVVVPMIFLFLTLAIAGSALGEDVLEKIKSFVKWLMTWSLKIILYVFTGYISITGVVSGSADAMAVKAAKLTISGAVPVVGSILSDASETILVSAGVMKNAVGIYGLLAIIAVWIGPFIQIGAQYLLLKFTAAVCGVFGSKRSVKLIQDFSGAMGMLLGMTGAMSLLLLISVVCFMKGVG